MNSFIGFNSLGLDVERYGDGPVDREMGVGAEPDVADQWCEKWMREDVVPPCGGVGVGCLAGGLVGFSTPCVCTSTDVCPSLDVC